jgi:DNA-binding transcriptional ArsR family regulator
VSLDRRLHALAEPMRRRILDKLRAGPRSLGELAKGLPVSRPAVSQHVKVLEDAGLVRGKRVSRQRIYSLDVAALRDVRAYVESFWDDVLGAFKHAADKKEK